MNINQVSGVINRVLNQYQVKIDAAYGVDTPAFSMILTTEIFKESAGVNKPALARKPASKPAEAPAKPAEAKPADTSAPAESAKVTVKPVHGKEKSA
jgi:hypothetical protein